MHHIDMTADNLSQFHVSWLEEALTTLVPNKATLEEYQAEASRVEALSRADLEAEVLKRVFNNEASR